jgi:hypothetical protein
MSQTRAAAVLTLRNSQLLAGDASRCEPRFTFTPVRPCFCVSYFLRRELFNEREWRARSWVARELTHARWAQGSLRETLLRRAPPRSSALHVGGTSGKRGGKRCSGRLAEPGRERG